MPAFSVGALLTSLFNVTMLSATLSVAVLTVVVVPVTDRLPVTVISPTWILFEVVAPRPVTVSNVSTSVYSVR